MPNSAFDQALFQTGRNVNGEFASKSAFGTDGDGASANDRESAKGFQDLLSQAFDETTPVVTTRPTSRTTPPASARNPAAQPANSSVQAQTAIERDQVLPFAFNFGLSSPGSASFVQSTLAQESFSQKSDALNREAANGSSSQSVSNQGSSNQVEKPEKLAPQTVGPEAFSAQIKITAGQNGATQDASRLQSTDGSRISDTLAASQESEGPIGTPSAGPAVPSMQEIKPYAASPVTTASPAVNGTQTAVMVEPMAPLEKTSGPAEPVRDISFQIPGARGVEVRVSDRAGELKVDVRSGDAALTENLRANLRELVNGLERKGFSAEVSHSGALVNTTARPGDTELSKEHSNQPDPNQGQGNGSARQQRQQQSNEGDPERLVEVRSPKARSAAWTAAFQSNTSNSNQGTR